MLRAEYYSVSFLLLLDQLSSHEIVFAVTSCIVFSLGGSGDEKGRKIVEIVLRNSFLGYAIVAFSRPNFKE